MIETNDDPDGRSGLDRPKASDTIAGRSNGLAEQPNRGNQTGQSDRAIRPGFRGFTNRWRSVMSTAVKAGDELREAIDADDLIAASHILSDIAPQEIASLFEQMESYPRAVAYRLLTKDRALDVFEHMDTAAQSELITLLREDEVTSVFDSLDPDDRVELLDELPAKVAKQLVRELSPQERDVPAVILGYPRGSVGRRMSPEFVHVFPDDTLTRALERVRVRGTESETIYTVPVIGTSRGLEGVISLQRSEEHTPELQPRRRLVRRLLLLRKRRRRMRKRPY